MERHGGDEGRRQHSRRDDRDHYRQHFRHEREDRDDRHRHGRDDRYGGRDGDRRFTKSESFHRRENVGRGGDREEELPELYSVCRARVHSVKAFGIFVKLDGCRAHGLVHLSQVSRHEVTQREDPDEVKRQALAAIVDQGDEVWVKIISVKQEDDGNVKIGCSMKLVGQSDGRDLDPNNLQLEMQENRSGRAVQQKVTLDAVYDVQCTRCGGHGHLKSECYSTGDKVYELLPDEADEPVHDAKDQEEKTRSKESSKKRSKLPDSVTTVEEAKALIASLKDEKKRKKKHRHQEGDRDGDKKHKKRRKEKHHDSP